LSTKEGLYELLNSHNWDTDKLESRGTDEIFMSIHCSICGLKRVFIVSDIEASTMKASQLRELAKEKKKVGAKVPVIQTG
jgi:hypothetical protein